MTLKGDRWGGDGLAYRKYERYLSVEGRKNRKAAEQLETKNHNTDGEEEDRDPGDNLQDEAQDATLSGGH
jgi:hypothetical protein